MSILIAYPGGSEQRDRNIALMKAHAKADELVKGQYWEHGKGCAVGCILHDYGHPVASDHMAFESLFGVPVALARLQDAIFENLPDKDSQRWPVRFWTTIQPGADLSLVQWKFLAFVVREALDRPEAASVREACQPALDIAEAAARGEPIDESAAWSAARSAESAESAAWSAGSAARSAAWSAAWSAWSVVWSAGRSAESAAWSAVWSAGRSARSARSAARSARSAARSAAWSAAWRRYADKLLELIAAAPVVEQVPA